MHQADCEELVVFWKAVMRGKRACPVWEGADGKGLRKRSTSLAAYFIMFSKVKAILRRLKGRTRAALLDALAVASDAVTPADAHG